MTLGASSRDDAGETGTTMQLYWLLNRVDELTQLVLGDPDDAVTHLWLAVALERAAAQCEGRDEPHLRYGADPTSLPYGPDGFVVRTGAADDTVTNRHLRQAFAIAGESVQHDHADARSLDAMARICLRIGYRQQAVQFARLAVQHNEAYGQGYATLAWACFAERHLHEAAEAARCAVVAGCSIGLQVLARMPGRPVRPPSAVALRAYYGPAPRPPTPEEQALLDSAGGARRLRAVR